MANLSKKYCDCKKLYVGDPDGSGTCEELTATSPNPCPETFWDKASQWNWSEISVNALNWSYALGLLTPPHTNLEAELYRQELERQRRQSMYIMVGMGVLLLVIILVVVARGRKK